MSWIFLFLLSFFVSFLLLFFPVLLPPSPSARPAFLPFLQHWQMGGKKRMIGEIFYWGKQTNKQKKVK